MASDQGTLVAPSAPPLQLSFGLEDLAVHPPEPAPRELDRLIGLTRVLASAAFLTRRPAGWAHDALRLPPPLWRRGRLFRRHKQTRPRFP